MKYSKPGNLDCFHSKESGVSTLIRGIRWARGCFASRQFLSAWDIYGIRFPQVIVDKWEAEFNPLKQFGHTQNCVFLFSGEEKIIF